MIRSIIFQKKPDPAAVIISYIHRRRLIHLHFIHCLGGDEDTKPKPDPHNALKICRQLGVAPEDALMIGDTSADTEFGKNAGFKLTLGNDNLHLQHFVSGGHYITLYKYKQHYGAGWLDGY